MAFGRDGSELELHVLSVQNRVMRDALEDILKEKEIPAIRKIIRKAIKRIEKLNDELD